MISEINGRTLKALHQNAIKVCKKGRVTNLVLTGRYPIKEATSDWVNIYSPEAKNWQAQKCPKKLEFNHGQYIDRYRTKHKTTAINFLINELRGRVDSNRACLSLIDTGSIINTKDNSIPSYMLTQVSMDDDRSTLSITSYYRALEVSEFLPINLAENCLIVDGIVKAFGSKVKFFNITIHAGIAHYIEHFSCLRKAKIDYQKPLEIVTKVANLNRDWIKQMLLDKMDLTESRINRSGLSTLLNSMKLQNREKKPIVYNDTVINSLDAVLSDIKLFNLEKSRTSHSKEVKNIYSRVKKNLSLVVQSLQN